MKILTVEQIRALDSFTIAHEPIRSADLMERASNAFVKWFIQHFSGRDNQSIVIFCGQGNNGGDGLAVARLLTQKFFEVRVYICRIGDRTSRDFELNLKRLPRRRGVPVSEIQEADSFPVISPDTILIDAIFGSGLNRPLSGYWATLINYLNELPNQRIAIDIPSGLFAEKHTSGVAMHADYTLSFELPKLAFFFPENYKKVGQCFIQPIGLSTDFIEKAETLNYMITPNLIYPLLQKRKKYDHKGTFGHALLIVGSRGKMGAALLAAKACLRSGAGLLTVYVPSSGYNILQLGCPEAMVLEDPDALVITQFPDPGTYRSIGMGCGVGTSEQTGSALFQLIEKAKMPLVLDADALNLLAAHPEWLSKLPPLSILTPHPKEFERIFGKSANDFERNELQRKKAAVLNCIIVLKGANTCVAFPNGSCYFNTSGNPGMATGGSGDVLTGMITGMLARGCKPQSATLMAVYLHGLAGDLACKELGEESLIAGDIIAFIPNAIKEVFH